MDKDSHSERLKRIKDMDLASQQEEMRKILIDIVKVVEKLERKFGDKK